MRTQLSINSLHRGSPWYGLLLKYCERHDNDAMTTLSLEMETIAQTAGFDVALQIMHNFGGTEICLSNRPNDADSASGKLRKLIGDAHFSSIVTALGAGVVLVPVGHKVLTAFRNAYIAQRSLAGASHRDLARELGVHIRTVGRAVARAQDTRQPAQSQ